MNRIVWAVHTGPSGEWSCAACAKHFCVHSGPEALRHEFNAIASVKDMEETYLPAFEDYAMKGRTYRYYDKEPLYPFGYGLTYGDCSAQEMSVKKQKAVDFDEDAAYVSVRVVNRGEVTEDVLQIYIHDKEYPGAVPNPSLCGFKRIRLAKGESREVTIPIRLRAFTSVDECGKREVRSRKIRIWAGFSQPDGRSEKLTGNAVVAQLVEF